MQFPRPCGLLSNICPIIILLSKPIKKVLNIYWNKGWTHLIRSWFLISLVLSRCWINWVSFTGYQLDPPPSAETHNVFHVSQLKFCRDPTSCAVQPLPMGTTSTFSDLEPEAILERKMVKRGRISTTKVLIKWKKLPVDQATWEFYYALLKDFVIELSNLQQNYLWFMFMLICYLSTFSFGNIL